MRLSVVSPNRVRAPDPLLPIGAATVAAWARELGHEVRILDLCHERDTEKAVRKHFVDWSADLIAISVRNLENNQLFGHRSFLVEGKAAVDEIRKASVAPIIAGGAGFSLFPADVRETLGVDYGFGGETEVVLGQVLEWFATGQHLGLERTVAGRNRVPLSPALEMDGSVLLPTEPYRLWRMGRAPLPAYDLLDCERYVAERAVIPVEGKRGCPQRCSFCPDGVDGPGVRLKDPRLLADEIEALVPLVGTNRLFFTDGVFHRPRPHAEAVCREIIERRLPIRWSCGVNPAGLDQPLLQLMREAGCRIVALGIDAMTEQMLRSYRKGFGSADIERGLDAVRKAGLAHTIHVLLGGPGESYESIEQALETLERLAPEEEVFIALGLRVFHGTELETSLIAEGGIGPGGAVLLPEPTYYLSPSIGEDVVDLLQARCQAHPGWHTIPL